MAPGSPWAAACSLCTPETGRRTARGGRTEGGGLFHRSQSESSRLNDLSKTTKEEIHWIAISLERPNVRGYKVNVLLVTVCMCLLVCVLRACCVRVVCVLCVYACVVWLRGL